MKEYVLDNAIACPHVEVGPESVPVSIFLDRLAFSPLGIGRDGFLIDDAFLLRVSTLKFNAIFST